MKFGELYEILIGE